MFKLLCLSIGLLSAQYLWANAEIPDYYEEPGYSSLRQSGQEVVGDNVDPFSGQLTVAHTDLSLPGNGGLDLNLVRFYSTYRANRILSGRSSIGHGWDIHMGRIYYDGNLNPDTCAQLTAKGTSEDNPVLELPGGGRKVFYPASTYSVGNNSRTPDFITKDLWIAECITHSFEAYGRTFQDNGMIVTSPEGVVYRFDRQFSSLSGSFAYVVTSITDPRGNAINITYHKKFSGTLDNNLQSTNPKGYDLSGEGALSPYPRIDYISTTDGRRINFNYQINAHYGDGIKGIPVISNISAEGKRVSYIYEDNQYTVKLKRVNISGESDWVFDYHPFQTNQCFENCQGINQEWARSNKLKTIRSPLGQTIRYDYDLIPTETLFGYTAAVIEKSVNGAAGGVRTIGSSTDVNNSGLWTYSYQLGAQYDETKVKTPISTETYRHFGALAASNGTVWKIGTLLSKSIANLSGKVLQTETYEWDSVLFSDQDEKRRSRNLLRDSDIHIPILLSKTIKRDDTTYKSTFSGHDGFGQPELTNEESSSYTIDSIQNNNVSAGSQSTDAKEVFMGYKLDVNKWILYLSTGEKIDGKRDAAAKNNEENWNSRIARAYYTNGLLHQENNNNVLTEFTYDDKGNQQTVKDANNHITTYSNYMRGIPQEELSANGIRMTRTVDKLGRVTSETDGRSHIRSYSYDLLDRIRTITPPEGAPIIIDWPSQSERHLTRGGFSEKRVYNNQGLEVLREVTGEETLRFTKRYDVMGRLLFESYPNSEQGVSYTYDALNRIIKQEEPGGKTQSFEYKAGNRVAMTDGLSHTTDYFYRAFGSPDERELIGIIQPEGSITTFTRDITGNVFELNQNGMVRTYKYNAKKFLSSEQHPETGLTEYRYDGVGNILAKQTNASGFINYNYDEINRIKSVSYPNIYYQNDQRVNQPSVICQLPCLTETVGISDHFVYDNSNNITQAQRSYANTRSNKISILSLPQITEKTDAYKWEYNFNANNKLINEAFTGSDNKTYALAYDYNAQEALNSIHYPSGLEVSYRPDNYGRPTQVGTFASDISYHPTGNTASITYANGVTTKTTLNQRYNIGSIDFGSVGKVDYTFNAADNITRILDTVNENGNKTLTYDKQHRLKTAAGSWGDASFNYDVHNNIRQKTFAGVDASYSYDSNNRLASYSKEGSNQAISYDRHGNINAKGESRFDYDYQGNMLTAVSASLDYRYDSNNRRVEEKTPQGSRAMIYGQSGSLLYERDGINGVNSEYIYLGSQLIAKQNTKFGLNISAPIEGDQVFIQANEASTSIQLSATAFNAKGEDVSSQISWRSDKEGASLGTGSSIVAQLKATGRHTITATISGGDTLLTNTKRVEVISLQDTDMDGIPDYYELLYGLNPSFARDSGFDNDNDGLTNAQEFQLGTNVEVTDSDGDGIADGWEVENDLNPLLATDSTLDFDSDGFSNKEEYLLGSNPSDGESIPSIGEYFAVSDIKKLHENVIKNGNYNNSYSDNGKYFVSVSEGSGYILDIASNIVQSINIDSDKQFYDELTNSFQQEYNNADLTVSSISILNIIKISNNGEQIFLSGFINIFDNSTKTQFERIFGNFIFDKSKSELEWLRNINTFEDVTPDGRYIVFKSNDPNLIPGIPNIDIQGKPYDHIYRLDRNTNEIIRITNFHSPIDELEQAPEKYRGDLNANHPEISDDGRYVIFISIWSEAFVGILGEQLEDGGSSEFELRAIEGPQVFIYDTVENRTQMITSNFDRSTGIMTDRIRASFLDGGKKVAVIGSFREEDIDERYGPGGLSYDPDLCHAGISIRSDAYCSYPSNALVFDVTTRSRELVCVDDDDRPFGCEVYFSQNGQYAYFYPNQHYEWEIDKRDSLYVKNLSTGMIQRIAEDFLSLPYHSYNGKLDILGGDSRSAQVLYHLHSNSIISAFSGNVKILTPSPNADHAILVVSNETPSNHYIDIYSVNISENSALDSDGDGFFDIADAFPNDPKDYADSDGDGVGNKLDAFPIDASETTDSDGDGVGDNTDKYPNDSLRFQDYLPFNGQIGLDFGHGDDGPHANEWNKVTLTTKAITDLKNQHGESTGIGFQMEVPFTFAGSVEPAIDEPFVSEVSSDYLGGNENTTYEVKYRLTGLDPNTVYRLQMFSRRIGSERLVDYSFIGAARIIGEAWNIHENYARNIMPNNQGEILVVVKKESVSDCCHWTDDYVLNAMTIEALDKGFFDDQLVEVSTPYSYTLTQAILASLVSAPDAQHFSIEFHKPLPNWLSFDRRTYSFSGTPSLTDIGDHTVSFSVSQFFGHNKVANTFSLRVSGDASIDSDGDGVPDNEDAFPDDPERYSQAPVLTSPLPDETATENQSFSYVIPTNTFSDPDGDALSLSIPDLPVWLSFEASTSTLTGTPSANDIGNIDITVTANDSEGQSVSDTFVLTVAAAPVTYTLNTDPLVSDALAPLSYATQSGVAIEGNSITKTAASGFGNASVHSDNVIPADTDGWVQITVSDITSKIVFGLNNAADTPTSDGRVMDLGVSMWAGSQRNVYIWENSQFKGKQANYALGDVLRVERRAGKLSFIKNGETMYTSTANSTAALRFEANFDAQGATLSNIETSFSTPAPDTGDGDTNGGDSGGDTTNTEAYYQVAEGDTWESIAALLYGTAAVSNELQQHMQTLGYTTLSPGDQLRQSDLPATIVQ